MDVDSIFSNELKLNSDENKSNPENNFNQIDKISENENIGDIFKIEEDIEQCFEEFTNITKDIMSFSNLKPVGKEIDLTDSYINKERKEFENISNEQIEFFNSNFDNRCNALSNKLISIDTSIKHLSNDEDLKKTNETLLSELRDIKFKQQEQMKELDALILSAKDALNSLDRNSNINNIYEYNIK